MSARASAIYLFARAASGALTLASVSLFAHGLGPEGYAWLALAVAGASLMSSLLVVPVAQSLARFLPKPGFEAILPTLARVFALGAGALLVFAAVAEAIAGGRLTHGALVGGWALVCAIGGFELAAQYANSTLQPARYASLFIVKAVVVFVAGWLALRRGWGPQGILLVMVLANLGGSVLVCGDAWKWAMSTPQPRLLGEVRRFALPLAAISVLSSVIQWSDRWLLAILAGHAVTGAFSATSDLVGQTMTLVSSAFFLAWYPRMVKAWEHGDRSEVNRLAERHLVMTLALLVPAVLGFWLVREDIANLLLGRDYYVVARSVAPWLALAACIGTMRTFVFDISLFISGRLPLQLRNVACAAIVSVALNLVLAPRLGGLGAGIAAVIAQGVGMALSWWSGRGLIAWRVSGRDLLAIVVAGSAMCVLVMQVTTEGFLGMGLRVLIGGASYVACMLVLDGAGARSWLLARLAMRRPA